MTMAKIIDGMPADQYHASPGLSSTGLRLIARTPAHYRWEQEHPTTSDEFDLGTVAHSVILEGDNSGVAIIDMDDRRTKAYKEAEYVARANGKIPLLRKDWAIVERMRDAVLAHPTARLALEGTPERSVFWDHETGIPLRVRADKHNPDSPIGPIVTDLKTTTNADPNEFGRAAAQFGYHQQAALYLDGFNQATGLDHQFLFVLVEKKAPYLVSVVQIHPDDVALGRDMNEKAIRTYMECTLTGKWPGYPQSEFVRIPSWAAQQMEAKL